VTAAVSHASSLGRFICPHYFAPRPPSSRLLPVGLTFVVSSYSSTWRPPCPV
jgi:hypothetical protein